MDTLLRLAACALAGLATACQGAPGPSQPEAAATSPPETAADRPEAIEIGDAPTMGPGIDWASAGDCRARLRLLHAAATGGALTADARPPITVVVHGPAHERPWPLEVASFVSLDLPLETQASASAAPREPCLIEIGPPHDLEAEHRTVAYEQVASEYQSGARSERNPEYDAVKSRVEQSERRLKDGKPGVLKVGDPMLDLIGILVGGVLSGFSDYGEEQELEDAMAELVRTPRTLERPTYRPYGFERTVVHAARRAVVPAVLRDRARAREWRTLLNQQEFRELRILDGLDPRDRDYEEHRAGSITKQDLEQWVRRPPELRLSSVVAALIDAEVADPATLVASAKAAPDRASPHVAAEPSEDLVALKGPSSTVVGFTAPGLEHPGAAAEDAGGAWGDPRLGSIVGVVAGARSGTGFYVRSDLVVTTHRLAGNATVVDLTTAGGQKVPGLLAAADPERDLALVQIPKPGTPVVLGAGPLGGPVLVVLGDEGRAIPVELAAGPGSGMLRVRSARFLHDGLIGAPVFLDRTVIGVLSSAAGRPNEMLVVPASAILEFVGRHAGPVAAME